MGTDNSETTNQTINELNRIKKELGLSYQRISELTGVPLSTVQKVLGNQTEHPRESTLQALRRVLTQDHGGANAPGYVYPAYRMGEHISRDQELLGLVEHSIHQPIYEVRENNNVYGTNPRNNLDPSSQPESNTLKKKFTVDDYFSLSEENRVELIHGVIYDMGSPTIRHQSIVTRICIAIDAFIQKNKGPCMTFAGPVDVQILADDSTMIVPDFLVICDKKKMQDGRIIGAPDFIVEVLSPSSRNRDSITKLALYAEAEVPEYWIVDPEKERVIVYTASDDYSPNVYSFGDKIPVGIYNGKCVVDMAEISAYLREHDL